MVAGVRGKSVLQDPNGVAEPATFFAGSPIFAGIELARSVLAALSYHDWLAHEMGRRLRDQFETRGWAIPFALGTTLFWTGLAATRSAAWWERVLWGGLALSFVWQLAQQVRSRGEA